MRREGLAKLTGQTRYLADLPVEGAWWGATVRSPAPRGTIRAVRLDSSIDWTEFVRVDARDIPGRNAGAFFDDRQPVLASDRVCHVDEPVLLLVHPSRNALRRAVRAVTVEVEAQPAALDFRGEPIGETCQIGDDNILARTVLGKGEPDAVLARAARIIQGTYETGAQEHAYLEPQAMEACLQDGVMTIRGSLQCPSYVQEAVAGVLGCPTSQVRIRVTPVGGGFGGKEDYPSMIAAHAGLLALAARRPVRLIYDRAEDMACTTKRHAALIQHRTAVAPDGELLAMEIAVLLDGGAYATLSPIVLGRAVVHATGPYRCPNVRVQGRVRMTNTVPAGAFRGFGNPQVHFAVERHMDRIADALDLDPAEVRRRNLLRDGDTLANGQRIADGVDCAGLLDRALLLARHEEKRQAHASFNRRARWHRRGIGFAASFHGAGLPREVETAIGSQVELEALAGGRLRLLTSIVEMGQGVDTVFSELVASRLGLRMDEVDIAPPDTGVVPDTGPSVASRTSMVAGLLVERACQDLLVRLGLPATARGDQVRDAIRRQVTHGGQERLVGRATYRSTPPGANGSGPGAYPAYSWAAQVAELEVDLRTGIVRLLDFVSVQDVGTVLNPVLARGQVQGGVAQAAGWTLCERVARGTGGAVSNPNLTDYVIPTSADLPGVRVAFVETPSPHGARGARGLGELPAVGAAAAIANAVARAIGAPMDRLPALPEAVLAALETSTCAEGQGAS